MKIKNVFGPIHSRRLGRSLGVNLLPFKTCSLDCIYCECGATTELTCKRKEFFPTDDVLKELEGTLASGVSFDYLTFSGLGEPTLHSGIGKIIQYVKTHHPGIRICLLTNATLLDSMTGELAGLDLIVPSLDGSNEIEFQAVNRPVPGMTLQRVKENIIQFRNVNPQIAMWLEIFIVPGINDSDSSIDRFCQLIGEIAPDKVQINTLDRKGAVDWIRVPDKTRTEKIREAFSHVCPTEIVHQ